MKRTNTIKQVKPAYIVDITNCEDADDMLIAFGETKQKAGFPISDEELEAIIDNEKTYVFVTCATCMCDVTKDVVEKPKKKGNIFKRFWNWLFGKKN